jgi:hypothetical protein
MRRRIVSHLTPLSRMSRSLPLSIALASAALGGCARTGDSNRVTSTSPAAVGAGADSKMDDIYRQIYTPGDPKWSN